MKKVKSKSKNKGDRILWKTVWVETKLTKPPSKSFMLKTEAEKKQLQKYVEASRLSEDVICNTDYTVLDAERRMSAIIHGEEKILVNMPNRKVTIKELLNSKP